MALRKDRETIELAGIAQDANARFGIAADNSTQGVPEDFDARVDMQKTVRQYVADAGFCIASNIEPSREASLALTALEEALMWAGKAIFK